MKSFFNNYGKYIIGWLMVAAIIYLWMDRGRMVDNYTAALAAQKVLDKAAREEKQRADYYVRANAELQKKLDGNYEEIDNVHANSLKVQRELKLAHKEIATLKECRDREIALNFNLTKCENNLKTITDDFVLQIDNLRFNFSTVVKLKDVEIRGLVVGKVGLVERVSVLTGKIVQIRASQARQRVFWFLVGLGGGLLVSAW